MEEKIESPDTDTAAPAAPETPRLLTPDDVVSKQDIEYKYIDVPEWGGRIRVGTLDAGELVEFAESNEGPARKTANIRLIIKSMVDESGNRIGKDIHIAGFKRKSSKVVNRIADDLLTFNGLDTKAREAAKND